MTRNQKLGKLKNAIRRYRGLYMTDTKKWINAPQKSAEANVRNWLHQLGFPSESINGQLDMINSFQDLQQFNLWLGEL